VDDKKPRGKQVGWRISEDVRRAVNIRAQEGRITAEELVERWLKEKLREEESKDQKERRSKSSD